jgi:hypothetical protein
MLEELTDLLPGSNKILKRAIYLAARGFRKAVCLTKEKFDVKDPFATLMTFTGMQIGKSEEGGSTISHVENISRLTQLPISASWVQYRSTRAKVAWATNSRPDICCAILKSLF